LRITYDENIAKAPAPAQSGRVATATLEASLPPVEKKHLLTAAQMAHFVTFGFVKVENLVPDELNQAVLEDERKWFQTKFDFWYLSENIRKVFEQPQVRGALQSLVGDAPIFDHSFIHYVRAQHHRAQNWHADSIIDARPFGFDVQAFYWTHDAPLEMGPTMVLPGSHLRNVNLNSIGRYKNFAGQEQLPIKAGTITFFHHGIWHCAQPNYTDTDRFVFKLRLRPNQEQVRLFNTDGYDSPEIRDFLQKASIPAFMPWQANFDRLDSVQRARLWRYVTGDPDIDVSFETTLSRMHLE
jgi:hypothetical protein